eukprot:COSAG04_NODE_24832_length_316_cov_0.811060_1_plen_35_part_10
MEEVQSLTPFIRLLAGWPKAGPRHQRGAQQNVGAS